MGIRMVAHAIIVFGTPEQGLLPAPHRGEVFFWGYSNEEASSDLCAALSVSTRQSTATTSSARFQDLDHAGEIAGSSRWCRTSRGGAGNQGITFVLISTDHRASDRPLVVSGEKIQEPDLLRRGRVPKSNVIGRIDDGWTVRKYLLGSNAAAARAAPRPAR